jgi:hypothetical protein
MYDRSKELVRRLKERYGNNPIIGAEIGVWSGENAAYLLQELPNLTLYLIDKWWPVEQDSDYFKSGDDVAKYNLDMHNYWMSKALSEIRPYYNRVILLYGDSTNVYRHIYPLSLDFVFIDGDHSYKGVYQDCDNFYNKVKDGGILSGHDWNPGGTFKTDEAVLDFLKDNNLPYTPEIGPDCTWWIYLND